MSDLEPFEPGTTLPELAETLSTLAGVVLGEETLDAVLEMIVSLSVSSIPDVHGASVSLARHGEVVTASATSEIVRELDAVQYEAGHGPCIDAIRTGERQHEVGAGLLEHWPTFGAAAIEDGVASMLSTPLAVRGRSVGALNLYATTTDAFDGRTAEMATIFADHAAVVLSNAAAYAETETTNENLMAALATRQVIGQAIGIIMQRDGCGSAAAFDVLRDASQHANVKLRDVAAELVRAADPELRDERPTRGQNRP